MEENVSGCFFLNTVYIDASTLLSDHNAWGESDCASAICSFNLFPVVSCCRKPASADCLPLCCRRVAWRYRALELTSALFNTADKSAPGSSRDELHPSRFHALPVAVADCTGEHFLTVQLIDDVWHLSPAAEADSGRHCRRISTDLCA